MPSGHEAPPSTTRNTSYAATNTKLASRSPSPVRRRNKNGGNSGTMSPKRLSDETRQTNTTNKKKSGLAGLFNNMLGNPKRPEISQPSNPVHVTHVGFDTDTGEFTVSK